MNRSPGLVIGIPVLVAGMLGGVVDRAGAAPPKAANRVAVRAGVVTVGIDAHLRFAAAISGRVTSLSRGEGVRATVVAYRNRRRVSSTRTNRHGDYTIGGLAASAAGYAVCVVGYSTDGPARGGGSASGYLGRCYRTAAWNGGAIPSRARLIGLSTGQHKRGIDIALRRAAAIAGTVRSHSGAQLYWSGVVAHNRSTGRNFTVSAGDGFPARYKLIGLTPSRRGYTVCFNSLLPQPGSRTGYAPRCYQSAAWHGGRTYPSTATPVPVSLGRVHAGISVRLPRGGAVSGRMLEATTGAPIAQAQVRVFTATGRQVGWAETSNDGGYIVTGLSASSNYRVCASPPPLGFHPPGATHLAQCWRNTAWNGRTLPSGITAVRVVLGARHTAINFHLRRIPLGTISGTITGGVTQRPVSKVTLDVFTRGGKLVSEPGVQYVNGNGTYTVDNLPTSSTGYIVCAWTTEELIRTPAGWVSTCYGGRAWDGEPSPPPKGGPRVPVVAGHMHPKNINIVVPRGGAISGTIYQGPGTTTRPRNTELLVVLYTAGGRIARTIRTDPDDSTYWFSSVPAARAANGYTVCFYGRVEQRHAPPGTVGYRSQCYDQIPWNGRF